ncbi:MAG TPA: hypothetical protein EYO58_08820 [Flavobacteriales bacterium]|nr:hypothetical protein [Flavobacteriales bacterium]
MAGSKQTQEKLNHTLKYITVLLIQYKITNWFIGYGTLLGIIRDNACIDGDDDIDIVCDRNDFDRIHKMLKENNINVTYDYGGIQDCRFIIKTVQNDKLTSIDFYCAEIDDKGNFNDEWEKVIWTKCYTPNTPFDRYTPFLLSIKWKDIFLPIPHNCIQKLRNRYGKKWHIPQNTKGPLPRLSYL